MTSTVCILGRQPAIGLAELESLYGSDKLHPVGNYAALLDVDPPMVDFSRLGGTVKFCKLLTILDTTNWRDIQKFLEETVPQHVTNLPEGKLRLGLGVYGLDIQPKQIMATGLNLKKVIKATGRSVRLIPNTEPALNSAQVLHNQLTGPLGWELIFVRDGHKTIVAQNIAEQDIEAYAQRDQGRPKRDARIGMLPPKLAQTIINLAVGQIELSVVSCQPSVQTKKILKTNDSEQITTPHKVVLDPFCGTGVILQEALLMGYAAYGTDIDPRMIDYSKANLEWLDKLYQTRQMTYKVEVGDGINHVWKDPFKSVAAEVYLGRPFTSPPTEAILQETIQDTNIIIKKFLKNLASQTKPGLRLCLALPAWKTPQGMKHLPLIDQIEDMGYNRLSFVHVSNEDLVYHREGQIVARELVVLIRA